MVAADLETLCLFPFKQRPETPYELQVHHPGVPKLCELCCGCPMPPLVFTNRPSVTRTQFVPFPALTRLHIIEPTSPNGCEDMHPRWGPSASRCAL
ncbi:hypothetical protein OH76DRAFT_1142841 [Lentinus brumalis]|uniref:Uncharacterized protein n=1 Tax=Lentinus brumalis TaxID=2498619 RepID=A0A371DMH6_9APHY|nr:hypothetical protein OH76DRAFT_1142841 [Polyporus brumalis]